MSYRVELLRVLQAIVSEAARLNLKTEAEQLLEQVRTMADVRYSNKAVRVAVASYSFRAPGMVGVSCIVKTLWEIGSVLLLLMSDLCHRPTLIMDLAYPNIGKASDTVCMERQLFRRWTGYGENGQP